MLRRRVLPWTARGLALLGLGALGVFAAGRVLTDSTHWSQYLWWVPGLWSVGLAWVLWGVSVLAGRAALRTGGLMARPLLLAGCVAAGVWLAFGEWNLHRAAVGVRGEPRERTLRVLHWNQSGGYGMADSGGVIAGAGADLVVVVNARYDRFRGETVGAMAALSPPGETALRLSGGVETTGRPGHFVSLGHAMVASRLRILRAGMVSLAPPDGADGTWRTARDPGFVLWLELDPGERFGGLGRPLVVWAVDLPSDPSLWRDEVMARARGVIEAWEGPALAANDRGRWRSTGEVTRVPEPDVVVGDFNTLRGSASLERLTPGMTGAFGQAGWGWSGSWRPEHPNAAVDALLGLGGWHIDLTLVGPAWRATGYRLLRTRSGAHRAQVADLVLR